LNWLWPRQLNSDDRITIRIVRLLHWCIVGFAVFGLVVSFIGLAMDNDREPFTYFSVTCVWVALAMLGRSLRYVLARE
jgi:cell division protein FtsW (lipid II flippase)